VLAASLGLNLALCGAAQAQVAPTPAEVSAYQGLHAAAHRGDLTALKRHIQAGEWVNATDRAGRTPLHVASFARQTEAVRVLLQAGADPARLEQGRYDAVTIAAVADDEAT